MITRPFQIRLGLMFFSISTRRNCLYRPSNKRRTQTGHPIHGHTRIRRKNQINNRASGRRFTRSEELQTRHQLTRISKRKFASCHRFLTSGLTNRMSIYSPIGFRPSGKRTINKQEASATCANDAICNYFSEGNGRLFRFLNYRAINFNRSGRHQNIRIKRSIGFNVRNDMNTHSRRRRDHTRCSRPIVRKMVCGFIGRSGSSVR